MSSLASAIAQIENTNPAYNNPGAISGTGDTGLSFGAGIGIYSTLDAGKQALTNQINSIYNGTSSYYNSGMTLSQFGEVYAPNQNYGNTLANVLGVPASTTLNQINPGTNSSTTQLQNELGIPNSTTMSTTGGVTTNPSAGTSTGGISGMLSSIETWVTSSAEHAVIVVVGLILIAAGVFSFKESQQAISTVAKVGKKAATLIP